jgi:hypothetical protein
VRSVRRAIRPSFNSIYRSFNHTLQMLFLMRLDVLRPEPLSTGLAHSPNPGDICL